MHPPYSALTVLLLGLAGLFLLAAAAKWRRLGMHREAPDERPAISIVHFRAAASLTSVALLVLAVALFWLALSALNG